MATSNLYVVGGAVGLKDIGMVFNPAANFTGCRLCGFVFQSALDRLLFNLVHDSPVVELRNKELQDEIDHVEHRSLQWRKAAMGRHMRRTHTEQEHNTLAMSGEWCTPEAAFKLAPLGVFPLQDSGEVAVAMYEAPRAPTDDVEGT